MNIEKEKMKNKNKGKIGDRVLIINSKYGMDKNLIGKKGTIVNTGGINTGGAEVFIYFVDIDGFHVNNYPFFEEEVEIL